MNTSADTIILLNNYGSPGDVHHLNNALQFQLYQFIVEKQNPQSDRFAGTLSEDIICDHIICKIQKPVFLYPIPSKLLSKYLKKI